MKYKRFILSVLIILVLIGLMLYSYQEYDTNDIYIKKLTQIFENSEKYNDTEISFTAYVGRINETNNSIHVSIQEKPYTYPRVELNTGNLDITNIKKGDLIDVIGIVDGKNHIRATKIWLNEPWKEDLIYIRSLPAIPFVLFLFLRTWKLNINTLRFERRKRNA
jgi:uncharacterized protein YxeA